MDPLDSLRAAWGEQLSRSRKPRSKDAKPWHPPNVWASRRRACVRAMSLDMMSPEDDGEFGPDTLERFQQGQEAEHAVIARLHQIGPFCSPPFEVSGQQFRFESRDRDNTLLISGKMDGRLAFQDAQRPPFEVKSGRSYDRCETVADLDSGRWSKPAVDQLLSYLLGASEPWGFILVRRFSALPTFIRVDLEDHLDRAESFLRDARLAVDARHARGPLPDFTTDRAECRRCSHLNKSCIPPSFDAGEGAKIILDEELIAAAEEREKHAEAAKAYARADKRLKESLRGVELGILGPYEVHGKWGPSTKFDVPHEVREQYKRVDEKGRFTIRIERADGAGGDS